MSDLILTVDEGVATVLINRPAKRNALSVELFAELARTPAELGERSDVRAIVLGAVGGHFCAGIDTSLLGAAKGQPGSVEAMLAPTKDSPANFAQHAAYAWREAPVPVIAALSGTVFGAGLQVALAADIRYASSDTRLSAMEIRWGIIPDMSIAVTLPQLVRGDIARELIYSGRIVESEEANEIGLVTRVVMDPLAEAQAAARSIAGANPHAVRSAKQLLNAMLDGDPKSLLALEETLQRPLLGSPNQLEAIAANVERRAPRFRDPS